MTSSRKQIIALIEQGVLPTRHIDRALQLSGVKPNVQDWRHFIDRLLLWLGALALAFACLFFIAYNWQALGRFARFGLVELSMAAAVFGYWKFNSRERLGKVMLTVAAILLGVLLALYGQTYQTGADPWQLFFNWALLILPWVLIARFAALWILWLVLLNLSMLRYYSTFPAFLDFLLFDSDIVMLWLVFIVNGIAWAIWEWQATYRAWLAERWALRVLAVTGGTALTVLAMLGIFDTDEGSGFAILVWLLWLGGLYGVYRHRRRDLFMLAGGCLSGISVIVTLLTRAILHNADAGAFLIIALVIIALGAGAAVWLKNIHREWRS